MGRIKKSFKQYTEEADEGFRKKKLKKESRHNYKTHLNDLVASEDFDELEDELHEQGGVYRR